MQASRAALDAKKATEIKMKYFFADANGRPPLDETIREAAARVRDAKGEAAKAVATNRLTELLDESFGQDMQARIKELKDIEARLERLRASSIAAARRNKRSSNCR